MVVVAVAVAVGRVTELYYSMWDNWTLLHHMGLNFWAPRPASS
jgi:hypothetical protein